MADTWHILPQGQRLTTELSPAGTGFTDVWEINYQVDAGPARGTTGTVRIPTDFYTPDYVKEQIDQAVETLNGVAGL